MTITRSIWVVAVVSVFGVVTTAPSSDAAKKLIHHGWDTPTPTYWLEHYEEIDQAPFDGTVFLLGAKNADGSSEDFKEQCWSQRKFTWEQLRHNVEILQQIHPQRMRHNFVDFLMCPSEASNVDWFDDFEPILHNCRLAARVARSWRYCEGVAIDPEEYHFPIWEYKEQKYANEYTYEQYAAQARRRGRQVMNAFEEEYPGITLFMLGAYSYAWDWKVGCLLPPFLDGMYEAAGTDVKIVDAIRAYGYKEEHQFVDAYHTMAEEVLAIVANDRAYRQHRSLGFGIWIDYGRWGEDPRYAHWHASDPSFPGSSRENYFSPSRLRDVVTILLNHSDEYAWLYNEVPKWWGPPQEPMGFPMVGGLVKIAPEYFQAVFEARKAAGLD